MTETSDLRSSDTADLERRLPSPVPFYRSKKVLSLWFVGILLAFAIYFKAPEKVLENLSYGVMAGLVVLIGGEALVDRAATRVAEAAVRASATAGGSK